MVCQGPFESVYAGHAALHSIYSHTITVAACLFSHNQALCLSILSLSLHVYFLTLRLTAYIFLHYQDHGRLFSHC